MPGCISATLNTETIRFWTAKRIRDWTVWKIINRKEWEWSRGQIKTCRKKQYDMKEMPNLICGKTAVGGNYNSTHDKKCSVTTGNTDPLLAESVIR